MNEFLRAIGFSNIETRLELDRLLGQIMSYPSRHKTLVSGKKKMVEHSLEVAKGMGITIVGEYDEKGFFHLEHYYPYLRGSAISIIEKVSIYRRMDTDSYTAMCDNVSFGTSLIFYLQNSFEYLMNKQNLLKEPLPITLLGFSNTGKILLPIQKNEEEKRISKERLELQKKLLLEAKEGDEEAINMLELYDMDLGEMINRRIQKEDLYSIVESSFMPYGSESDNYTIIGEIQEVVYHENIFTGEIVVELVVEYKDVKFYIAINKNDLVGYPLPGRRFKGQIWLQGNIDFRRLNEKNRKR